MDILKKWLNQKGDNAADALNDVLISLGYSTDAVVAAIQAEQKATRLAELADQLTAEGIDEAELVTEIAAKKAEKTAEIVAKEAVL